jgi:hypothetical protein
MGLAFLPWERLPAYVVGPFFCVLNAWLIFAYRPLSIWRFVLEVFGLAFGVWVTWSRYKTREEPLWTEEQRAAVRKRREEEFQ